jgi:hypothetical protein
MNCENYTIENLSVKYSHNDPNWTRALKRILVNLFALQKNVIEYSRKKK